MENNKYYFEFSVNSENDLNFDEIEKVLNKKADFKVPLNKAKEIPGRAKRSRVDFRTEEMTDIYVGELFDEYIKEFSSKVDAVLDYLKKFEAKCDFCVVFTDFVEKPCLGLNEQTIQTIAKLNASIDYDFC